jgi:hypothetical protein
VLRYLPSPHVRHFASLSRRSARQGDCKGDKQIGCHDGLLKGFVERLPLLIRALRSKAENGIGKVCHVTLQVDQHVPHGHRVVGNQQIVNWDSGRTVAILRVPAETWLDREFSAARN